MRYKKFIIHFPKKLTEEQQYILVSSLQSLCENIKKDIDKMIQKTDSHFEFKIMRRLKVLDSSIQGIQATLQVMRNNIYKYIALDKKGDELTSDIYYLYIAVKEVTLFDDKSPLRGMIIWELKNKPIKAMGFKPEEIKIDEKTVEVGDDGEEKDCYL